MTCPNLLKNLCDGYLVEPTEAILTALAVQLLITMAALLDCPRLMVEMDSVHQVYRLLNWEVAINLTETSLPLGGFRRFWPNPAARFVPAGSALIVLQDELTGALEFRGPRLVWCLSAPGPREFALDVARAFIQQVEPRLRVH
jgi:hypothetical protein